MAVPVIQGKVFMRLFALFLVQNHLQYENGGDNMAISNLSRIISAYCTSVGTPYSFSNSPYVETIKNTNFAVTITKLSNHFLYASPPNLARPPTG